MKDRTPVKLEQLKRLEPIASLSDERLEELIPLVYVEQLPIGGNLFREGDLDNQAIYLLSGDIHLSSSDGKINRSLNHKSDEANFPLDDSQPRQASCSALTRVELLRIDNSVLDYMMMWDQLAVSEDQESYEKSLEEKTVSAEKTNQTAEKQSASVQNEVKPAEEKPTPPQSEAKPAEEKPSPPQSEAKPAEEKPSPPQSEAKPVEEKTTEVKATHVEIKEQPVMEDEQAKQTAVQDKQEAPAQGEEREEGSVPAAAGEDRSWIRKMRHIMAFKSMPPANIKRLLERMESIEVKKGETIINQGEPGEYYYVLTEGQAEVTRTVKLADLEAGRSFGEEALISEGNRNASVSMKTNGIVMRLSKDDFNELLQEPLLNRVSPGEARIQAANGAVWLDVRHAREYHHSHLPKAINIPLHELRMRSNELDTKVPYICYCSTGRRSAAAAFLLVQKGFMASVLNGGIKVMATDLVKGEQGYS